MQPRSLLSYCYCCAFHCVMTCYGAVGTMLCLCPFHPSGRKAVIPPLVWFFFFYEPEPSPGGDQKRKSNPGILPKTKIWISMQLKAVALALSHLLKQVIFWKKEQINLRDVWDHCSRLSHWDSSGMCSSRARLGSWDFAQSDGSFLYLDPQSSFEL